MKIASIIDKIRKSTPEPDNYAGVDVYKWGNPEQECTGIVCACFVSVDVIQRAAELGANLIIAHEPIFYSNPDRTDWLRGKSSVFKKKSRMLEENGMVVWRFHDHMHANRPDLIFEGVTKELGWEDARRLTESGDYLYRFPERSLASILQDLKDKIGLNGVRYIGNADAKVSSLYVCGHLFPTGDEREALHARPFFEEDYDVLVPGEAIDWTAAAYARDASLLGENKAFIELGHFNLEELGMKYAADWLRDILDGQSEVSYIKSADMFSYF